MERLKQYTLAVCSGLLLGMSWNPYLPAMSMFLAFIPLLLLIEDQKLHFTQIFNYTFLSFIIYHLGTVWWLSKSSFFGFVVIIVLNSMVMAFVMVLISKTRHKLGAIFGGISFIVYWLAFEYIHYHWELSWPFMNLGNWLGQLPEIIQWYEYTGVLGGSLWVLLSNLLLFIVIKLLLIGKKKQLTLVLILLFICIVIPIVISRQIYKSYSEQGRVAKIKIVQPNIDPYTEKYNKLLFKDQIEDQIKLAIEGDTVGINCYLFPESSFPVFFNEDSLRTIELMNLIDSQLILDRKISVLGGSYSYKIIDKDSLFYNTAFMLNNGIDIQLYHKSKLVIGVEKIPFQDYFKFVKNWNLDFGGINSSLAIDNERKVFYSSDSTMKMAPVICYESVYGAFVSEFVKSGATSIVVITNDAWWGETPGYKQHLMNSQVRAIETRRSLSRSANTGLSCFINQKGEIISQLKPWEKGILLGEIKQNSELTFYTKFGDYIGLFSVIVSMIFLIYRGFFFVRKAIRGRKQNANFGRLNE